MGLDTSHNCWHGAYSAFMRWRQEVARAAGLPPLQLMEGFYAADSAFHDPFWAIKGLSDNERYLAENLKRSLPIKWDCLKPSALYKLLYHSDCCGHLEWKDCDAIADELETVAARMPEGEGGGRIGNWRKTTQQFIDGLREAARNHENVEFH
jgi:hypothetical protein